MRQNLFMMCYHTRTGLNYSEFAVVAEKGTFGTAGQVVALAEDLSSR